MRRRARFILAGCLAACTFALLAATAHACPMCSQSIAEEDLLPHAYMYSILFMLGMPATVLTGIGGMIYFKFRKLQASAPSVPGEANAAAVEFAHSPP